MFVVDAREGWKPQSEEQLRILDLVGVTDGVVVLTKVEGVDVEPVRTEVAERLTGSCLADAPILATDALAGIGIDDLRAELERVAAIDRAVPAGRARLCVDRSFTIAGAGTVVTGTLTGGPLCRGDDVEVGGRRVDLGTITVPFLHVAAEHDHIVPTAASAPLVGMVGSKDKNEIVLKGGHVSLVAGGNAIKRLWPNLVEWLGTRST